MREKIFLIGLLFCAGLFVHIEYVPDDTPMAKVGLISPNCIDTCLIPIPPMEYNTVLTKPVVLKAQVDSGTENSSDPSENKGFLLANWKSLLSLLLLFVEGILRLTPSEKDNSIFNIIKIILDTVLPNRRNPSELGNHP
jgi:hypothetical protein